MKTIIFFGIIRSGNHGLLNTIIKSHKNPIHINNAQLDYKSYIEHSEIEIKDKRSDGKYIGFKGSDCVIISIENRQLNMKEIELFLANVDDVRISILIRNPYNCLSSVSKVYVRENTPSNLKLNVWRNISTDWIKYCEIILDPPPYIYPIIYDKVFSDETNYNEFLRFMGITSKVSKEVKNATQNWGESSWRRQEDQRRMGGTLEDCLYAKDEEFVSFVKSKPEIENLWNNVLKKYF